jgi:hypothetical protein
MLQMNISDLRNTYPIHLLRRPDVISKMYGRKKGRGGRRRFEGLAVMGCATMGPYVEQHNNDTASPSLCEYPASNRIC